MASHLGNTIQDVIKDGKPAGETAMRMQVAHHNFYSGVVNANKDALAEDILLSGGVENLSYDYQGRPRNDPAWSIYNTAQEAVLTAFAKNKPPEGVALNKDTLDGMAALLLKSATGIASFFERCVPELTDVVAKVSSSPSSKGVSVSLRQDLLSQFGDSTAKVDKVRTVSEKYYDHDTMGGNIAAYEARALHLAAQRIDPDHKIPAAFARSLSKLTAI